jgi:hypothetical protein
LDVATSFWIKINQLAKQGQVISIDKVKAELYRNKDLLTDWCSSNLPSGFFADSAGIIPHYSIVIRTANARRPSYNQRALDTFFDADEADAWLIAHALAKGLPIVTHEISQPARVANVKIPDICQMLGIETLTTIEMFRQLGESF